MIAPDWHEARRSRVGCSELAALFAPELVAVGYPPHRGPWSLWSEKAGRSEPAPRNGAQRLGQLLEDTVLELTAGDLGCPVVPWSAFEFDGTAMVATEAATGERIGSFRLPDHVEAVLTAHDGRRVWLLVHTSGLCGTPDAIAFPADGHGPVVVDAKTCGMHAFRAWREREDDGTLGAAQLPAEYEFQGRGYMMLTGLSRALFAAFRLPPESPDHLLHLFWLQRERPVEHGIARRVARFLASLPTDESPGVEPPLDPVLDADAAHRRYGRHTEGRVIVAGPDLADLLTTLETCKRAERTARERAETLIVQALPLIGDAEVIRYGDKRATARGMGSRRSVRVGGQWS